MARIVPSPLVQAKNVVPAGPGGAGAPLAAIPQPMIDKHVAMVRAAASDGRQIVCLDEIFNGPYFCAEQTARWHDYAERVPDGPTVQLMILAGKRTWRRAHRSHLRSRRWQIGGRESVPTTPPP